MATKRCKMATEGRPHDVLQCHLSLLAEWKKCSIFSSSFESLSRTALGRLSQWTPFTQRLPYLTLSVSCHDRTRQWRKRNEKPWIWSGLWKCLLSNISPHTNSDIYRSVHCCVCLLIWTTWQNKQQDLSISKAWHWFLKLKSQALHDCQTKK